jgi:GWxTD domain-containing protein
MRVTRRPLLATLALGLLLVPTARADKLSKEDKSWLELVGPLMLADEKKQFEDLKKGEREEFQKIFWARRDPDLETPGNEFRDDYEKRWAEAQERYKIVGRGGATTDCGRVFLLFGTPEEIKHDGEAPVGRRAPETWIYRDRPGFTFKDGHMDLPFDEECRLPGGSRFEEQLDRVAARHIVNPNLSYQTDKSGKLTRLADQLPKPSPVRQLLREPRTDFPLEAEQTLVLRSPDGADYVAGLVRGTLPAEVAVQSAGDRQLARLAVAAQATAEDGKGTPGQERDVVVDVGPDRSFLASYSFVLQAGKYEVRMGALDPKSGRGAVTTVPIELPDYSSEGLKLSSLMILSDIVEIGAERPATDDPLAAFALTGVRLVPRFGRVFAPSDSVSMLIAAYGAATNEATGKASVVISFALKREGKLVARAEDTTYDSPTPTHSVGPIPLEGYQPGKFTAEVRVKDNVSGAEVVQETPFEVAAPGGE